MGTRRRGDDDDEEIDKLVTGLIRDADQNGCIRFPNDLRDQFREAPTPERLAARMAVLKRVMPGSRPDDYFFLLEGQPDEVHQEWAWAMGLSDTRP